MTNDENAYPTSNAIVKNIRDRYLFALSGDTDVFVHASDFSDGKFDDVCVGDALTIEIIGSPKGPRGRNVRLTEVAHEAPA